MANFNHPYNNKGSLDRLYADYQKYDTLYIAFDFDNTIWDYDKFKSNYANIYDAVHWNVVEVLKKAKKAGMKLILWTSCPTPEDEILKTNLCSVWGIKPDYINWSPLSPNAIKPHFNLLIDDRAGLESSIYVLMELIKKIEK